MDIFSTPHTQNPPLSASYIPTVHPSPLTQMLTYPYQLKFAFYSYPLQVCLLSLFHPEGTLDSTLIQSRVPLSSCCCDSSSVFLYFP